MAVERTSDIDLRWRLSGGKLPMRERHLRSLLSLGIDGPMQSWVRTRIEFVLDNHAAEHPDGAMHLVIAPDGKVTFSVEPLRELPVVGAANVDIATGSVAGIPDATVWLVGEKRLVAVAPDGLVSAIDTTLRDLASTLGYAVEARAVSADEAQGAEVFATTDEHGVVPVEGCSGEQTAKFAELLGRLWGKG